MPQPRSYYWYLAGVTCFFIPQGLQTVLFPYIIAVQLGESADRLGLAQMSIQLPAACLILFGGVLADRLDPRKILIAGTLLAACPVLLLAMAATADRLSYPLMISYAVVASILLAFLQPARDTMLNQVSGGKLQRTVTIVMGLTFGAQVIGFAAASMTDTLGIPVLLLFQAVMLVTGAAVSLGLQPAKPLAMDKTPVLLRILDGLELVFKSTRMRPAMIMLLFMSVFYGGSFMVLNPIIVRDIYGGDAARIALSFAAFVVGTIATTIALVSVGGLKRPGRGLILAILFGGLVLAVSAIGVPFPVYLLMIFLWGMGGGVAMSMGRTIMQEAAPDNFRARVMSIFSLGNMTGAPVGALMMGYIAATFGPLAGLFVAALGASSCALLLAMFSPLYRMETLAE